MKKTKLKPKDYCTFIEDLLERAFNNRTVSVIVTAQYKEEPEEYFDINIDSYFKAKDVAGDYEKEGSAIDVFASKLVDTCKKYTFPVADKWCFTLSIGVKEHTNLKAAGKIKLTYTRRTDSWELSSLKD